MIAHYKTLTDLWRKTALKMFMAKHEDLDRVASIDTMIYDNQLSCDSMEFDFDMGRDLWLNKQRFTVLQRAYLNPDDLEPFLDRCAQAQKAWKRGVVTGMLCRQHSMAAKKYRWGNCMQGFVFRGGGKGEAPQLSLHSRVSYIAYIGGLDLALCHVLAREIGDRIDLSPSEMAFRWNVDSLQFHGFKSIPFLFGVKGAESVILRGERKYPSEEYPTLKLVRRWWKQIYEDHLNEVPLEAQKYGPLRRIRRRYEEWQSGHRLPAVTPDDLDFSKLRS